MRDAQFVDDLIMSISNSHVQFVPISTLSLQRYKSFLAALINGTSWTSQSLNLLLSSSSRLVFVSKEFLKLRFHQKRRKNFLLELQIFVFQNVE